MATTNEQVRINFVTAFDGRALNNARSSILSMESLANRAIKTFGSLFAAQKITQFARASVTAFAADQAAAEALSKTLTNLGLAFETQRVADYIQALEKTSGVLDDQLRPAFARFARQTGDVAKSQELLNLALDVSAGTGQDLMTVSNALAKAYGGQYTSLSKLGAGLTKADLATNNFALIQGKLTKLFAGQAAVAADSYQGKINKLKVAYDNLQETVGQSLTDAFLKLSGKNGGIDQTTQAITNLGDEISYVIGLLANLANSDSWFFKTIREFINKPLEAIPIIGSYLQLGFEKKKKTDAAADAANQREIAKFQQLNAANIERQRAAAAAKAKADQAALLKAEKDKLALQKAQLALKMDSKVLDLQQIELFAAMQEAKGTDLDRLKLQQAILDGNATAATTLANKVLAANGLIMDMQGNITANPFAAWNDSLNKMLDTAIKAKKELDAIKVSIQPPSGGGGGVAPSGGIISDSTFPGGVYLGGEKIPVPSSSLPALTNSIYVGGQKIDLNISLDNGLIVKQNQDASSNGVQTTLSRNNPGYF